MDSSFQHQQRRLRSSSSSSASSFSSASSSVSSNSETSMLTAYSPPLQPTILMNTTTTTNTGTPPPQAPHKNNHNNDNNNTTKSTEMFPPPAPKSSSMNCPQHQKRPLTRSRRASLSGVFGTNGNSMIVDSTASPATSTPAKPGSNTLRSSTKFNNKTLRRSTGLLNLDEASLGSPAATKADATPSRASSPFGYSPDNTSNQKLPLKRPLSGSGSSGESTPSKFAFPKPKPVQQVLQQHMDTVNVPMAGVSSNTTTNNNNASSSSSSSSNTDSPSFYNMIPNAKQAAKMRKMNSMDNLFMHVQNGETNSNQQLPQQQTPEFVNPFATSPSPSPTSSFKKNRNAMQPQYGISKPKLKFNSAINADMEYNTPDNNYKSVKPLQAAFMSTGLLSKRNRTKFDNTPTRGPPETPCKKPSTPAAASAAAPFSNQQPYMNHQPFQSSSLFSSSTPPASNDHSAGEESELMRRRNSGVGSVPSRFGLRDTRLRFSGDFGSNNQDEMMYDAEEPATPTKDHSADHSSVWSSNSSARQQQFLNQNQSQNQDQNQNQNQNQHQNQNQNQQIPPPPQEHQSEFAIPRRRSSVNIEEPRTPAKTPKTPAIFATRTKSDLDSSLSHRFDNVSLIGRGEFSMVYAVSQKVIGLAEPNRYAVKRTKVPFLGPKARSRRLEEVEILKQLGSSNQSHNISGDENAANEDDDEGRDYLVHLYDAWEENGHLYIQTDFCENGNLETFISEQGSVSKLDEWRVWKILVELTMGVNYIHQQGFLHLDLKPANVFITFEGSLKIGDFGMATRYPATRGIEREGDREYIAPEILSSQRYDKPADIFSLGLMMLEIAANIVLPDNGVPWQKLRSGDLTEAGRLSSGDLRASHHHYQHNEDHEILDYDLLSRSPTNDHHHQQQHGGHHPHMESGSENDQSPNSRIPSWAPKFMVDNSAALDKVVHWMLDPDPSKRPTAMELLNNDEIAFVETHRKAGAVIYEGDFGPEPDITDERQDEEMQL